MRPFVSSSSRIVQLVIVSLFAARAAMAGVVAIPATAALNSDLPEYGRGFCAQFTRGNDGNGVSSTADALNLLDSLNDGAEAQAGTDPLVADTDGDGLSDGIEVLLGTDPSVADSDSDGLSDGVEVNVGSNPSLADSDGDGVFGAVELGPNSAHPSDTDADGVPDVVDTTDDRESGDTGDTGGTGGDSSGTGGNGGNGAGPTGGSIGGGCAATSPSGVAPFVVLGMVLLRLRRCGSRLEPIKACMVSRVFITWPFQGEGEAANDSSAVANAALAQRPSSSSNGNDPTSVSDSQAHETAIDTQGSPLLQTSVAAPDNSSAAKIARLQSQQELEPPFCSC